MGPIFNKKVTEKCNLRDCKQCIYALFTVDKVNYCGLEKKKKREKRRGETQTPVSLQSKQSLYISIHEGFDWLKMSDYPSKVLEISTSTQC